MYKPVFIPPTESICEIPTFVRECTATRLDAAEAAKNDAQARP